MVLSQESNQRWSLDFVLDALACGRKFRVRGIVVTRLAIAGASVPQIATITGHSFKDVETILDAHYLTGIPGYRDTGMTEAAISKLEKRGKL